MSAIAWAWRLPSTVKPRSTPKAPAQSSSTMQIAVRTKVAPRSSCRRRDQRENVAVAVHASTSSGVDICRTLVDEMVEGVMTPSPGISGKSGDEA